MVTLGGFHQVDLSDFLNIVTLSCFLKVDFCGFLSSINLNGLFNMFY